MGSLRWGYMGTGRIAHVLAGDFALAGLHIQAVGSRHIESAKQFGARHAIAQVHGSYEELVANSSVDIVYISTLNPLHCENALLAINAGKHVLLEKPFTMNADQARKIEAAGKSKGVFVMEAMWTRFLPSMAAVFKCIADGMIGVPRMVLADHSQYFPPEISGHLWERSQGGGALLDLGIYPISLAAHVLGIPSKILAVGRLSPGGIDEAVSMIFGYENGAQAALTTCCTVAGPVTAAILGTDGSIEIDRTFYAQTSFNVYNQDREVIYSFDDPGVPGTGRQMQAIEAERCVEEGLSGSPLMSVGESVDLMRVMDEVRAQIGVRWEFE